MSCNYSKRHGYLFNRPTLIWSKFRDFFAAAICFLNNLLDHSNAKNLHAEVGELQDYLSVGFGASKQHQWHAQVESYTVLIVLVLHGCVGYSGSGLIGQKQLGSPMVDYLMLVALTVDTPPRNIGLL
jgi:hypothetical protein